MIETSITAWILMLAAVLASSGAGLAVVRVIPWSDAARQAGIPRAFAFAIAPFLLGMLAVLALGVFRGASHAVHLGVVFAWLLLLCSTVVLSRPLPKLVRPGTPIPIGRWEWVFAGLLTVWVMALIVNTAFLPLIQNDSLEYATVGRLLFESRDLFSYPALDPEASRSGFFGPWTHPPLYAALIYLTYTFQGNAESPLIMRIIAPWFALCATALVFTLGNQSNRLTGLLSALFFLSVPLFYLGASYALIDALPVLGMTIVMATITGVKSTPLRMGIVQGFALGFALWTHSTAVLFIPLAVIFIALHNGWNNLRALTLQISTLAVVFLIVAAWPYCRNLVLHDALISDNPAVFAVTELAWDEYFRLARGLDTWPAKIQYGFLKGWFALEAYALLFWLMTAGAVIYVKRLYRHINRTECRRGNLYSVPERLLFASLGVVVCYLGGVFLSLLIGTDLMIRNERYFLILLPCVALLAGSIVLQSSPGVSQPKQEKRLQNRCLPYGTSIVIPLLLFVLMSMQLFVLEGQQWSSFGLFRGMTRQSCEKMLWNTPAFSVIHYIRLQTPKDETVLSMRPADMYYADRRMISYLDPRLLPFYRAHDAESAYHLLKDLGVRYVQIHEHTLPPVYNSALQEILNRQDLSHLTYSAGGNQLYELRRANLETWEKMIDLSPGVVPWTRVLQIVVGGRKGLFKYPLSAGTLDYDAQVPKDFTLPVFTRDLSMMSLSGRVSIRESAEGNDEPVGSSIREYQLGLDLEGNAFMQVYVMQFSTDGILLDKTLLGELTPGPGNSVQRFSRRFIAHPDAKELCFGVEHRGNVTIRIMQATLMAWGKRAPSDVFVRWRL
jgi:4-amino-4-deoxy-L-arabinose transferase-like glycosyltransferase